MLNVLLLSIVAAHVSFSSLLTSSTNVLFTELVNSLCICWTILTFVYASKIYIEVQIYFDE